MLTSATTSARQSLERRHTRKRNNNDQPSDMKVRVPEESTPVRTTRRQPGKWRLLARLMQPILLATMTAMLAPLNRDTLERGTPLQSVDPGGHYRLLENGRAAEVPNFLRPGDPALAIITIGRVSPLWSVPRRLGTRGPHVAEACALCVRSLLDVLHHVASAVGRISGIVVGCAAKSSQRLCTVTASGSVDRARLLAKHFTLTQSQTGRTSNCSVSVCGRARAHCDTLRTTMSPGRVAPSGSAVHAPRWASQVPANLILKTRKDGTAVRRGVRRHTHRRL